MILPNLASKGYATVDEYVQDVISKIERNDETLTTLQIDDLHYPMCSDLPGGSDDYLDSDTIAEMLTQAPKSSHIRSLELRFVEFDDQVSQAFQKLLLMDPHRTWESISVTACSGLSSGDICALASALDRCHTLHWHHNQTSHDGLGTLGMSLASSSSSSISSLKVLHITREDLKGEYARALLDPLLSSSNSYLTTLVLNFCRFDNKGVDALAEALAQNSYLQELDLGACYLNDAQVERVVMALKSHPTLRSLVLTLNGCHCRGAQALSELLQQPQCTLEYLNLSHQKIDDAATDSSTTTKKVYVQPIAKALIVNTSLRCLRLSRNRLQCEDVASLFHALQTSNQTLRVLDLNSNAIGDDGATMLACALSSRTQGLVELHLLKNNEVLRSPKSCTAILQALKESNRTLEILELHGPSSLPHLWQQIRYELALNAGGRRILSSSTPNQIPLGLWPKVLERATCSNDKNKNKDDDGGTTQKRQQGWYFYYCSQLPKASYQPDTIFHMLQASALLSQR
jgi:Ran GTPase-activating protein (RanGAP) involved in mRNA processing and transport